MCDLRMTLFASRYSSECQDMACCIQEIDRLGKCFSHRGECMSLEPQEKKDPPEDLEDNTVVSSEVQTEEMTSSRFSNLDRLSVAKELPFTNERMETAAARWRLDNSTGWSNIGWLPVRSGGFRARTSAPVDEEVQLLTAVRSGPDETKYGKAYMERRGERRMQNCFLIACFVIVGVVAAVGGGVGFVVWRTNNIIGEMGLGSTPMVHEAVNNTMGILRNAEAMSSHVHTMTEQGAILSTYSLPELIASVNATAAILRKFQRLSNHPMLQISLEEGH